MVHFGLLHLIPMIQAPFCSFCVALQYYESGMQFFHHIGFGTAMGLRGMKINIGRSQLYLTILTHIIIIEVLIDYDIVAFGNLSTVPFLSCGLMV